MAGESAHRSARQQREKAARLLRSAELWERGAVGEERTAALLSDLDPAVWTVFHDIRWPGRQWANIDHVVVGPPGVLVVDTKNWSGRITVNEGVLRQNGRSRQKAVAGAAEASGALAAELRRIDPRRVYPVLCFVGDEPMRDVCGGVRVCSTSTLVDMLTTWPPSFLPMHAEPIAEEVGRLVHRLESKPVVRRTGATQERRRRPSPQRSTARRSSGSGRRDLVRLLLLVAMMLVLVTRPEWMQSGVQALADWFVGTLMPTDA